LLNSLIISTIKIHILGPFAVGRVKNASHQVETGTRCGDSTKANPKRGERSVRVFFFNFQLIHL